MFLLNNKNNTPLYTQLYKQIKEEILSGNLKPFSKLPSSRRLSNDLQISRNTVEMAYQQLYSEGYITSKQRSGYFIENLDINILPQKSIDSKIEAIDVIKECENIKYDFQYGNLDPTKLPISEWQKISNKCFRQYKSELGKYNLIPGELGLRKEILKYLRDYRDVRCNVDQIIVESGIHSSFNIICQLIKKDVSEIAIEEPGFFAARNTFENYGLEVCPIELDSCGLNVKKLNISKARAVYVTPSYQFPTGTIMPISRRLELVEWANKSESLIIEDDYSCHLRYNIKPIPSIQSLSAERVIHLGSFSKFLFPSIRVSYMVLPEKLVNRFYSLFENFPSSVPFIVQKTLQHFMEEGYWDSYIRKTIRNQKRKHDALVHTLDKEFGDKITILAKNAGLHIVVQVKWDMTEDELIKRAYKAGVKVYPTSVLWNCEKSHKHGAVMMGFGAIQIEHIPKAVKLLKKAWLA